MELKSFDALLHLGDYDYHCKPDLYFKEILNSNRKYQFMGVIGNHDAKGQCTDEVGRRFLNNVHYAMVSEKNHETKCEFSESRFMWSCVYKNMVN